MPHRLCNTDSPNDACVMKSLPVTRSRLHPNMPADKHYLSQTRHRQWITRHPAHQCAPVRLSHYAQRTLTRPTLLVIHLSRNATSSYLLYGPFAPAAASLDKYLSQAPTPADCSSLSSNYLFSALTAAADAPLCHFPQHCIHLRGS